MKLRKLTASAAVVVGLTAGALVAAAWAAETVGPVTDEIGVVKLEPGEPIVIGTYMGFSGAEAPLGIDILRGIKLAADEVDREILGHPIRILDEDGLCSAEGGQTAATKLAANQKVVAVVGGMCSSESTPGAPILWRAGIVSVSPSSTAPVLTAADRDQGYHGFARVAWNDAWAGSETARWAYNERGARRAAGIHDGSPYAQGFVAHFVETFEELGGTITSVEAVAPTDTDMWPMLTRLATGAPEVVFAPLFVQAMGQVVRQRARIAGLENTEFIGSDASMSPQILELGGAAIKGLRLVTNDISTDNLGPRYKKFLADYRKKHGESPTSGFHHFGYDAMKVAIAAIQRTAVEDDAGNLYIGRRALRDAVFATKGLQGLSGEKTCNEHGDCGNFNFTLYEYVGPSPAFELGVNPKKVYPQ